jgi:hypothetical protein
MIVIGACWVHKGLFEFDPETVPSVLIDPVTQLPPDLGGDEERARREPICPACIALINPLRAAQGKELFEEG